VRRARIERTGQPVYANEIDRQPPWRGEDLVCWERDCAADVREVVGYTKRDGTPYPAYFRLKKNVEHGAGCPLNPVEVITSIAQGSEGLATVDEGVLRLTLPQDISQPGPQSPGLGVGLAGGEVVDRRITTVPPLLPPLINSAVKIVRFLAAHDFDGTVVNRFKVLPYGAKRPVLWEKFCYGPTYTSYSGLYTLVRTGKRPTHPVAVYGTVQHVRKDRSQRPYAVIATADPTGLMRFEVVLRSGHSSLIDPLTEGTHVLAVGDWDVWADGRVPQLRLFAEGHWQIAYWASDNVTGDVSEPSCPPAVPGRRATVRPKRPSGSGARTGLSSKAVARRPVSPSARRSPVPPTPQPPAPHRRESPPVAPQGPRPVTEVADSPSVIWPITPANGESTTASHPAPASASPVLPGPTAADDQTVAPSGPAPTVPPRPPHPPQAASPPPLSPRRRGLTGWLGRRKNRG